jgi:iron complex outermembrane receptor protein
MSEEAPITTVPSSDNTWKLGYWGFADIREDTFNSTNSLSMVIHTPQATNASSALEFRYEAPGYTANADRALENIRPLNMAVQQRLTEHIGIKAAAFYYDLKESANYEGEEANATFNNVEPATFVGGDFGVEGVWGDWRVRLGYTCTDAGNADDEGFTNAAEHAGKVSVTAPVWGEKVFANLEVLTLSDRLLMHTRNIGGYWLINGTLFSREIAKGLEVSASVYNLFALDHSEPVGDDFLQDALDQEGRMFRIKVTYRF